MGKGCTNSRTILRDVLETRVLAGLQDRLMEPEAFAEAMRSFIEETNRLNHIRRANHGADVERLEKARKAIAGIVTAIEDGGYSRPLMERLRGLEANVEEIEAKLAEAPRDVPILREETYQRILAAAETGNPPLHVAEDDLDVDENQTRPEKDDGEQDDSPEEPQGCGCQE